MSFMFNLIEAKLGFTDAKVSGRMRHVVDVYEKLTVNGSVCVGRRFEPKRIWKQARFYKLQESELFLISEAFTSKLSFTFGNFCHSENSGSLKRFDCR